MKPTIGVLALQGDFAEHRHALVKSGAAAIEIRHSWQLADVQGLVIPGGESTAIAKLTEDNVDPIFETIKRLVLDGMPVYGTCMGSIFLAKEIEGSSQGRLALMDINVRRNAFGAQRFSFEVELPVAALGACPFPAVFIRAPMILSCGALVQVLARYESGIVMARQSNMLVTAFHPEITGDMRVHQYFLEMVKQSGSGKTAVRPLAHSSAASLSA